MTARRIARRRDRDASARAAGGGSPAVARGKLPHTVAAVARAAASASTRASLFSLHLRAARRARAPTRGGVADFQNYLKNTVFTGSSSLLRVNCRTVIE